MGKPFESGATMSKPKFKPGDIVVLIRYPKIRFEVLSYHGYFCEYRLVWKGEEAYEDEEELEHAHIAASPLWQALR